MTVQLGLESLFTLHWNQRSPSPEYASESIQTLVLAALQSVSITAVFEYGLVDWFQRPFGRCLNNFVFKITDA